LSAVAAAFFAAAMLFAGAVAAPPRRRPAQPSSFMPCRRHRLPVGSLRMISGPDPVRLPAPADRKAAKVAAARR
jgi:hypothetical protein